MFSMLRRTTIKHRKNLILLYRFLLIKITFDLIVVRIVKNKMPPRPRSALILGWCLSFDMHILPVKYATLRFLRCVVRSGFAR